MAAGGTSVPNVYLWRWSCVKAIGLQDLIPSCVCKENARPVAQSHASTPTAVMAAEVARFFQDLRGALRLTPEQTAEALATRVYIIAALEAGRIGALPPWPETCRIVRTYAGFAGLDPRPVLHSLEQLYVLEPRAAAPKVRGPRRNFIPNLGKQGAPIMAAIGGGGRRAAEAARNVRQVVNDHAGRPGMALFTVTMAVALILLVTPRRRCWRPRFLSSPRR